MEEYIKLKTKLQLGKSSNIKYVHEKDLDNIENIRIDTNLPKLDKVVKFLKDVKNPYIFMVDGIKVKFEFSENGNDITKCFENLILNKAKS